MGVELEVLEAKLEAKLKTQQKAIDKLNTHIKSLTLENRKIKIEIQRLITRVNSNENNIRHVGSKR